uniref:Uncharacterized protein n=1 Tax=Anguilla anguilla TaxID=7936 RepID=A0A0E9QII3_ANGAN
MLFSCGSVGCLFLIARYVCPSVATAVVFLRVSE